MSSKTLSTKSSKQIINLLKKSGIEFLDYNEELLIHKVSSLFKNGRNAIVEEIKSKGRILADKIEAFSFNKEKIHIETSWYNPRLNTRHAMALLYYPQEYKLEFFDPTGYKHIDYSKVDESVPVYGCDWTMYIYLEACMTQLKKLTGEKHTFVNMNEKNMNEKEQCNTISIIYHFLSTQISFEKKLEYIAYLQENGKTREKLVKKINDKFVSEPKNAEFNLVKQLETLSI